jgi:hypothetical protein
LGNYITNSSGHPGAYLNGDFNDCACLGSGDGDVEPAPIAQDVDVRTVLVVGLLRPAARARVHYDVTVAALVSI